MSYCFVVDRRISSSFTPGRTLRKDYWRFTAKVSSFSIVEVVDFCDRHDTSLQYVQTPCVPGSKKSTCKSTRTPPLVLCLKTRLDSLLRVTHGHLAGYIFVRSWFPTSHLGKSIIEDPPRRSGWSWVTSTVLLRWLPEDDVGSQLHNRPPVITPVCNWTLSSGPKGKISTESS